jgi:hypothetical protein
LDRVQPVARQRSSVQLLAACAVRNGIPRAQVALGCNTCAAASRLCCAEVDATAGSSDCRLSSPTGADVSRDRLSPGADVGCGGLGPGADVRGGWTRSRGRCGRILQSSLSQLSEAMAANE